MSILNSFLIGSHLIGLLFLNLIPMPKGVEISHDLPATTVIGSEHWVYVTIEKKKIGGFAKFQVDVPKGIQIEPGDLRGASFTFAEGAAKIIWMSLPQEDEFQISYKLTVFDDCEEGNNTISQRFAYLDKNQRKIEEIPDHVMFVGSENVSNQFVPDTLANGIRTITQLNGDHFLVQIDLYKDGIKGFAKIEEILPEGLSAEAVKKSNAVFTQIDNKVKFVWFSIPEEDSLYVVYEVFADEPVINGLPIQGEFTYLRNNVSKSIDLQSRDSSWDEEFITESISDSLEEAIDTTEVAEEVTEEVIEEVLPDTSETQVEEVEETVEEIVEETQEEVEEIVEETQEEVIEEFQDVTDIPDPETGVAYRVQIAAGKNVVDEVYFEKRHSFTDPFTIENHEKWVKYTTGSFPVYKEARDKRNFIRDSYNFDGPFVTAYNDGRRITVQEALMITEQKWYQ
ncbi:MAG: hypothetical protein HKN79_09815 [Flavobacteriales bacterium]|nr:hypothetical protein [Flavobacteriales bacterium]